MIPVEDSMIRVLKKKNWFHNDGFPIAVERRNPQEPFGLHSHEFAEIVVVTAGQGLHITGDDAWQLSSGDVFVIGKMRPHDYQNLDNLCLINILFDLEDIKFPLADLKKVAGYHALFQLEPTWRKQHQFKSKLKLSRKDLVRVCNLVDALDDELIERGLGFQFFAIAEFMQIVGYLSRCYGRSQNTATQSLVRLGTTLAYLESSFAEPIKLQDLIDISQLPKSKFIETFVAATGSTPIAYLIQLRLSEAARLLAMTEHSITRIAFDVGFQDSNYFSRQFKNHFGTSPRQYRKKHQQ